jgi:hypothetical protein
VADIPETNLDTGADSPAAARLQLLAMLRAINATTAKLDNVKTPEDFTGPTDYDRLSRALDSPYSIYIGRTYSAAGLVATVPKRIWGPGLIRTPDGLSTILRVDCNNFTVDGVQVVGYKPTNEARPNDIGIVVNNVGFKLINGGGAVDCAYTGLSFASQVGTSNSPVLFPSLVAGAVLRGNGIGINTGEFEYVTIGMSMITDNGWNNARTDKPVTVGANQGCGVMGRLANTQLVANEILSNGLGAVLTSIGGNNPDHNKIIGNTFNHNQVVGLELVGLLNHEAVVGNTALSNVVRGSAPGYVDAELGSSADLILRDVYRLNLSGANQIGGGSCGFIPVYGHGSCSYVGNILQAPMKEMRHPQAGAALFDTYGFTKNAHNLIAQNNLLSATAHQILSDSIATVVKDGHQGGLLIDDVPKAVTFYSGWSAAALGAPMLYWRHAGNKVTLQGSLQKTGTTDIAFNIPAGWRPVVPSGGYLDVPAVCNGAWAWARIYGNGDVQPLGAVTGSAFSLAVTFMGAA